MALGRFSYDSFEDRFSNRPPDTLSGLTGTSANPRARAQTARRSTRRADLPAFSFDSLSGDQVDGKAVNNPAADPPPPPTAPPRSPWDSPAPASGDPWSLSVERASTPGAAPAPTSTTGTGTVLARFDEQMRALQQTTDPNQQAIAKDRLARDLYTSLQQDGHDVKWQGDQLLVDGRAYAVGAGAAPGTAAAAASATAGAQAGTSATDVGGTLSTHAAQTTTPRPTAERIDPGMTGSLDEAVTYLQQQAQRVLGRALTQDELNTLAAHVGYQPESQTSTPQQPNHRPGSETGTPEQAIAYVQQEAQRMLGRPLNDAEMQQAIGVSGYTGSGPVTGDQVNLVLDAIAAQAPPTTSTTGGGQVTGDMVNRALDLLESWWTDPGSGGPPDPGPSGGGPPGTNFPNGSGGQPYTPGTIPMDDLEGFDIDAMMSRLSNQFGKSPVDFATQDLVMSILQHPESMDAATVDRLKAKSADELAEMSVFQDDEIKRFGYQTGNEDSNWIASERTANRRDRDRSLIGSNRDIETTAAAQNFQDRLAAAGLGQSFGAEQRRLSVEEAGATRENLALASDSSLRAAALKGDRLALREQVAAKAAELGIAADELQLKWVLGQMDDLTTRYGIDVGAEIDREQLAQQSRQFQEDLAFKLEELRQKLEYQYSELDKRDQWFGAGLGLDWFNATNGGAGTGGGPLAGTF